MDIKQIAEATSAKLKSEHNIDLNSEYIYAQLAVESANGTSDLATLAHNYSGIKLTDGTSIYPATDGGYFRVYKDDEEFINSYAYNLAAYKEDGMGNVHSLEDFSKALCHGHWFGDTSLNSYNNAMRTVLGQAPIDISSDTVSTAGVSGRNVTTDAGANVSKINANGTSVKADAVIIGAGMDADDIDDVGILDFATFAQQLSFKAQLQENFNEDGTQTVHDYLSSFMTKFYHQIYYVPNLKNNYVMLVKPETLFVNAPTCNLIFPNIKSNISYVYPFKEQPTRLLQTTDPLAELAGSNNTPMHLTAAVFIEEEALGTKKNGMTQYKNGILGIKSLEDQAHPMLNLTEFEQRNGIRVSNVNRGADIYLFLKGRKKSTSKSKKSSDSDSYVITLEGDNADIQSVGQTIGRLAAYELCRQRYVLRQGSLEMYFNPYIVPGFPMVSIETSTGGMNIYGYVTNVVHNISERSWSTTVSFNCGHTDTEASPGAFPIVESEYTSKLNATYQDMLGETVKSVTNKDIPGLLETYGNAETYMTTSYRKIWRETPSLEEYLENVADKAVVTQGDGYLWLKNGEGSSFFNTEVQERIRQYTEDIMNNHIAMNNEDFR